MRSLLAGLVLLATLAAGNASATTARVTGSVPKDPSIGQFQLTIEILELPQSQIGTTTDDVLGDIAQVLSVTLDVDGTPIKYTYEDSQTMGAPFYAEKDSFSHTSDGTNNALTYVITVKEGRGGLLAEKVDAGQMKTGNLSFKIGEQNLLTDTPFRIGRDNYAIDAAVDFTSVIGSHKSLVANWQPQATVSVKGEGGDRAPSNVTMYVVDSSVATGTVFPAKSFVPLAASTATSTATSSSTTDADATCTFVQFPAEDGKATACLECDAGDVYLNDAKIAEIDGIHVKTAIASAGSATVTGLENSTADDPKFYYVFLEYKPSGLRRSQCAVGYPQANFSLTELNGEADAKIVDFRCFIATAAYGTPLHDDINVFRRFRDESLLTNRLGRGLVALYYRVSPPAADFIASHASLRDMVRGVLSLLAESLRSHGYAAADYHSRFDSEPYYAGSGADLSAAQISAGQIQAGGSNP